MCNGYDLLDDMEVGEMFDVLMDNVTMKQDFSKPSYSFEDVHNLQMNGTYSSNVFRIKELNGMELTIR